MHKSNLDEVDVLNFLPVSFQKVGQHTLVQLFNARVANFSFGFFNDSVNMEKNADNFRILPLKTWLNIVNEKLVDKQQALPMFIFHVSRCGSTLLCQNLKSTNRFIVLGEPSLFQNIYRDIPGCNEKSKSSMIVNLAMKVWSQWAWTKGKGLVVKLSSSNNLLDKDIIHDFPESKRVCLIREPTAVLESLIRQPPKHLLRSKSSSESLIDTAAKRYKENISGFMNQPNKNRVFVDYSQLQSRFNSLVKYLDPDHKNETFCWDDRFDAKNPKSTSAVYYSLSESKYTNFSIENKSVIEPLTAHYKKIVVHCQDVFL